MGESYKREPFTPAKAAKALEDEGIRINQKQFAMILFYLRGASITEACVEAGLSETSSWAHFNNPRVVAAIGAIIQRFLIAEAAPGAMRVEYMLMNDAKAPAGVRLAAAKDLLDRAGFSAKAQGKQGKGDGDITTKSVAELRDEIERLEREIERQAVDVTPDKTPDSAPDDDYLSEFA